MRRLLGSLLCLFALAAAPQLALGQSAGDDQYSDPFAGEEQPRNAPDSSRSDGNQVAAQPDSDAEAPATNSAPSSSTSTTQAGSGSGSNSSSTLAYTGFPTGLVALLGAFALAAGLALRTIAGRPPARRRDAVLVLGRDLRLQPRARHR